MVSTVAERWVAMRAIHETFGVGVDLLCSATGRSVASVTTRMNAENWSPPNRDRSAILTRMSAMLQAQLGDLEEHVNAGEGADEKSVRTLGTLARTWEKLNTLEQLMDKELDERRHTQDAKTSHGRSGGPAGAPTGGPANDDAGLHALRLELEKRIAALVERKSQDGFSQDSVSESADRSGK
ncbi:MAG: hypothetical protein AAF141_02895 [Pseudomonadota bacterium]